MSEGWRNWQKHTWSVCQRDSDDDSVNKLFANFYVKVQKSQKYI